MAAQDAGRRLSEIAGVVGGELRGADVLVSRPVQAGADDADGICFGADEKHLRRAVESNVAAIIVPRECPAVDKPVIAVDNPRAAFGAVLSMFARVHAIPKGLHKWSMTEGAEVSPEAAIGACAYISEGAVIEAGAQIFPLAFVGPGCRVGKCSLVLPGAVLLQDVEVGDFCIIHAGAVVGSDGFGYVWDGEKQVKVPHAGSSKLGDHVEVGANATIDRAPSGQTVIGDGSKIDNLVQIAHGVKIGDHSVIAAQAGISGSTKIGDRVTIGGQVGMVHHVEVASESSFGGGTVITRSVKEGGEYAGVPAKPIWQEVRIRAALPKVPDLLKRVKALEDELETLKKHVELASEDPE